MEINRRKFLLGMGAAASCALLPKISLAGVSYNDFPALSFVNPHTNEKLTLKYRDQNGYYASAMNEVKDFFRDYRTGEKSDIDPRVIDRIFGIDRYLGGNNIIELISGYRSAETNAVLHERSSGVARHSYHILGKAADISMPKRHIEQLYNVAKAQNLGGSGIYVRSNFVHVDTGPLRTWGNG